MRAFLSEFAVLLAVIFALLCALAWVSSTACSAKWINSGMRSEWTPFAGCRIQTPDGKWIPAESYREMP